MHSMKHGRQRSKKLTAKEDPYTLATATTPSGNLAPILIPLPIHRPRLLLASDSTDRLRNLQGLVRSSGFEITSTDSIDKFFHACLDGYEVIALDVAPAQLEPALKLIRSIEQNRGTLILVEASQINNDLTLAGVLPLYRAMPCSRAEITKLLRRMEEKSPVTPDQRGML